MTPLLVGLLVTDIELAELHGPTGQRIYVNPAEVTSIIPPQKAGHFAKGTQCVIYLSSRNFIPVGETCDEARKLLEHPQ